MEGSHEDRKDFYYREICRAAVSFATVIGQWITTTLRTVNGCGSSFACHFSAFDGRPTTPLSASRRVLWTRRVIILFIWRIFPCNEKITTQNSIEILFTLDEERKSDLSLNNFSKVSAKIKWKNSIQLSWWKKNQSKRGDTYWKYGVGSFLRDIEQTLNRISAFSFLKRNRLGKYLSRSSGVRVLPIAWTTVINALMGAVDSLLDHFLRRFFFFFFKGSTKEREKGLEIKD